MLKDASSHRLRNVPAHKGAEWAPRRYWQGPPDLMEEALAARTAPLVEALEVYANEGRWVVSCPNCGGAQLACREDPRFLCNECCNVAIGGRWRPVIWPVELADIESALEKRQMLRNRNWLPGETAQQLLLEQEAMAAEGGLLS